MDSKKRKQVASGFKVSLYYVNHIWTLTLKLTLKLKLAPQALPVGASLSASALWMIVIVVGVIVSLTADQKDFLY